MTDFNIVRAVCIGNLYQHSKQRHVIKMIIWRGRNFRPSGDRNNARTLYLIIRETYLCMFVRISSLRRFQQISKICFMRNKSIKNKAFITYHSSQEGFFTSANILMATSLRANAIVFTRFNCIKTMLTLIVTFPICSCRDHE